MRLGTKIYHGDLTLRHSDSVSDFLLELVVQDVELFLNETFDKEDFMKFSRFRSDKPISINSDDISIRDYVTENKPIEIYYYTTTNRLEDMASYLTGVLQHRGKEFQKEVNGLVVEFDVNYTSLLKFGYEIYEMKYTFLFDGDEVKNAFSVTEQKELNSQNFSNATKLYVVDTYTLNSVDILLNFVFHLANTNDTIINHTYYTEESKRMALDIYEELSPYREALNNYLRNANETDVLNFLLDNFDEEIMIGTDNVLSFIIKNKGLILTTIMKHGKLK